MFNLYNIIQFFICYIIELTNMQTQNVHTNPVNHKIRKNKHRNQSLRQFPHLKENQPQNCENKKVLKQISMNLSLKSGPVQIITKLFNTDANQMLNKSYSVSQAGEEKQSQKYINHIKKQNEQIRQKIKEADDKLQAMEAKKTKLQQKYRKLKQSQCSKLKGQVKKLNYNMSCSNNQNSDMHDWNSLLEVSATNQHKSIDSRIKLSDIRQKNSELDFSSIKKFAKQNRKQIGQSLTRNLKFQ